MHVDMARIRAQHTFKRPQPRGDDRQVRLGSARNEVHGRFGTAALLANEVARALAVRVLAIPGGLSPLVLTSASKTGCAAPQA